jgi:hypothetical protein
MLIGANIIDDISKNVFCAKHKKAARLGMERAAF